MDTEIGAIRVLVSCANSLMRKGIISDLAEEDTIKVVGQVSNRLELMEFIYSSNPDVVILIEDNNGTSISETISLISQKTPETKLLVIIKQHDEDKELALLGTGVKGFLTENTESADIIKCVKVIGRGEMWVRRRVLEKYIQQLSTLLHFSNGNSNGKVSASLPSFTKREIQIMTLVGKNYRNKEIGLNLYISGKTVKNHMSDIFKKLHVRKRVEVRRYLTLVV